MCIVLHDSLLADLLFDESLGVRIEGVGIDARLNDVEYAQAARAKIQGKMRLKERVVNSLRTICCCSACRLRFASAFRVWKMAVIMAVSGDGGKDGATDLT